MKRALLLPSFVAALSYLGKTMVDAFPSGAGGCDGPGVPAVGGLHTDDSNGRPVVQSSLADGAIEVTIGDLTLNPDTVNEIPVGEDLLIAVEALDIGYLGVLMRLQVDGIDTAGALVPGANTQEATVCAAPVVGITHTDNEEKTLSTGTLRLDESFSGGVLDVTVVFINTVQGSAYVFDSFDIQTRALDDTPAPSGASDGTPPPTPEGTPSDISAVSDTPSPSPTEPTNTPPPTGGPGTSTPTASGSFPTASPSPSQHPTDYNKTPPFYGKGKGKGGVYYYGKGKAGMKSKKSKGGYYGKGKAGMKSSKGSKGSKGDYYYGKEKGDYYYGKGKSGMSSSKYHYYGYYDDDYYYDDDGHYYYDDDGHDDYFFRKHQERIPQSHVERTSEYRHEPAQSVFQRKTGD